MGFSRRTAVGSMWLSGCALPSSVDDGMGGHGWIVLAVLLVISAAIPGEL